MKLNKSFYLSDNVLDVAKCLLGKRLCVIACGELKSGIIVETEAYSYKEKACHAYNFKNTKRTATLFENGGVAYVYLCYGIHKLFNIVTNVKGIPEGVLIRAVEPTEGIALKKKITSGPGKLTKAMGITLQHNQMDLTGDKIWIEDINHQPEIEASKRIGVDYAGEDAELLWRFTSKNNHWISK
ncbi:DNA-3-methyladenine glycosylase [Fulvivirga lutea]|uniref:Putative 3-methyladenine DNA glycosylase n=1 Tax=Fulvivirga lutea TaxID=2810512 RepID=A0A974WFG8_9BACT|nr:DNA-3-methyladenine glycosylase [Fulvivirga lutea]QSE96533.1 DNA-3-methyladenine glycosylase [Fulvivirga lutea]